MSQESITNTLVHRYVDVPCPSGKHQRTICTFRNHTVAAMFCLPCEFAWTEPTAHPALRDLHLDRLPLGYESPSGAE